MTSASSDGGMDACSISSDNGRSPRHRTGGDQHHAATAFGVERESGAGDDIKGGYSNLAGLRLCLGGCVVARSAL
jgi:hypothetical protein